MSLLLAKGGLYTIRLVGRWRSDTMLHYLHTTANIFTNSLAVRIIQHGEYTIILPVYASL